MAFFVVTLIMILVAPTLPANQQSHRDHPHSHLFFPCLALHRPQVLQQHTPPSWPDGSVDRAHGLRHRPVLNPLPYQPKLHNFKYFLKHGSVTTLSLFFALIDVSSITQCIFYPLQDERNCWNLGTNPYTQQFRINMIMIINPLFA